MTSGQRVTRQGKEGAPWKEPVDTCSPAGAASECVTRYISGVWH